MSMKIVKNLTFTDLYSRLEQKCGIENQVMLAKLLDLGPSTVNWSKQKDHVPLTWIVRLEARGFSREWLVRGEGEPYSGTRNPVAFVDRFVNVPVMSPRFNDDGTMSEVEPKEELHLARSWAQSRGNEKDFIAVRVSGDDMAPEIKDGNMVVIDTERKDAEPGRIFAIKLMGYMVVRKVVFSGTGVKLVAISENSEDIQVDAPGKVEIVGKVIWSCREHL